jgi:glucosamine--fructose-6-phosphate aminotransferase (isomerizing)
VKRFPMFENISSQPDSHRSVLRLHQSHETGANKEAACLLSSAKGAIYFTGMGASLFASYPAAYDLLQHGISAHVSESSELLHYALPALRTNDVGVLISRSGQSVEVLHLAEQMRKKGMKIIGVSNITGSPLEQYTDVNLHIGSFADQLVAVQTYTGTVLKLMLLADEVLSPKRDGIADICFEALPALTKSIEDCFTKSSDWQEFLQSNNGALYFLGRGPALGSASEGALLFHETAKEKVVAMSSGQFRHGPVEAVSNGFRAVMLGGSKKTLALESGLANDLCRMGANVRWIGPEGDSKVNRNLMTWPNIDPRLAALFEIVPLQIAAYRLALWRDIVPGDFRYASEITSTESGFPLLDAKTIDDS